MSTHALERRRAARSPLMAQARQHLRWLGGGLSVGFLVPFVFADLLDLQRDLFYGIYTVAVAMLFLAWARATDQALARMIRRRWFIALALGLAGPAVMAGAVLRTEDATARPDGLELVAAVLWRGVMYGLTDGLLLSAFPILVVFAAFEGSKLRERFRGKVMIGSAALLASIAMTALYHVGYADFRSEKPGKPVAGDPIWSAPTLITLNPIGAPIAHAGLHVSAVLHSNETDVFLPPHE